MPIRPGEIYLAPIGGKDRPVVVVSREELNRGDYAHIVPFTTQHLDERRDSPSCVFFRAGEFGLDKDCVAQADSLALFYIVELQTDSGPIGALDDEAMRDVIRAIGYVFGAECEPE